MQLHVRLFLILATVILIALPLSEQPQTATAISGSDRANDPFCVGVIEPTGTSSQQTTFGGAHIFTVPGIASNRFWESIFRTQAVGSGSGHSPTTEISHSSALGIVGLPEDKAPPPLRSLLGLAQTVDVGVNTSFFSPRTVTITAGDTIRWTWIGNDHTVTSGTCCDADGQFCSPSNFNCDTSASSNAGDEYSHQFNTAGTFQYFCRVHGGSMSGTVMVNSGPTAKSRKTGVFRPSTGELFLKNSNSSGFADTYIIFGNPGDYPIAGDWNGDGIDSVGIYRDAVFYLRNSNSTGFADLVVSFGSPGDQPVVGDWNGDGTDTIGIYRNGTFILRNSNTAGPPDLIFTLGDPGDVAIAGDWNGDGIVSGGVFRPSNGIVYLRNSNTTGFADVSFVFGNAGDKPVAGDWNADGIDSIGIYRNGLFYLSNSNTTGFADIVFVLGNSGDFPIAGNWNGSP